MEDNKDIKKEPQGSPDEADGKAKDSIEDIHDASYGLNRRGRAVLMYVLTALICAGIIVSSYGIALKLPKNSETLNEYAETLRKGEAYKSLKTEYTRLNAEVEALDKLVSDKEKQVNELDDPEETKAELRNEIEKKQSELKKINDAVADKTEKIAAVNAEISAATGVILSLSPGRYTVGTAIAPGRYTITGQGGFACADAMGQSKYNTTLSNAAYEIELSSGDRLKLDCTVKFTPAS